MQSQYKLTLEELGFYHHR